MSWQDRGACRDHDPEIFFPAVGKSGEPAKRICRSCPVMAECRNEAIDRGERNGIWGGLAPDEITEIRRARGIPRRCRLCGDPAIGRSQFCDPCRIEQRRKTTWKYDHIRRVPA
jgi:WhiB family redox-sensing transcriptional regulator